MPEQSLPEVARPREKKARSIRFYAVALVLVTAIPLVVLSGLGAYNEIQRLETEATDLLRQQSIEAADDVKRWLAGHKRVLGVISEQLAADPSKREALVSNVLQLSSEYSAFLEISPDGRPICRFSSRALPPLSPEELLERPIVQTVIEANAFVAGGAALSPSGNDRIMTLGQPVLRPDGRAAAYVFLSIKLDEAAISLFNSKPHSPIIVIADQNAARLLQWPDPEAWIGKPVLRGVPGVRGPDGVTISRGASAVAQDVEFITASLPIDGTPWRAAVQMPVNSIADASKENAARLLAVLGLFAAFFAILAYFGARLISRPIQAVARLASAAAERQSLPDLSSSRAPKEIIETARALVKMNRTIAASEERYRDLLNGTSAVVWEIDATTLKTNFVTKQAQSLLGYAPGERELGQFSWTEHIHPEDLDEVIKITQDGAAKGGSWEQSYRVISPYGGTVWVRSLSTFVPDAGVIRGLTFDITKQVEMERALATNDARNRAIIDASPVPSALNDDKGNIVFLNRAFMDTFGYGPEDISTLEDWWPKAYPDAKYRQWVADEWTKRLEEMERTGQPVEAMDLEVCAKDGSVRHVLGSAKPLDALNRRLVLVTLIDVTERELAREKEKLYRQVWEQSSDYLLVMDKDGRILDTNPSSAAALGRKKEELIGLNTRELFAEQPTEVEHLHLRAEADRLGTASANRFIKRKDGSVFHISSLMVPLRDARGEVTSRLVISRDQTDADALLEVSARNQQIIEASPVACLLVDANGNNRSVNSAFTRMLGYTKEEARTSSVLFPKVFPDPTYRERIRQQWGARLDKMYTSGASFEPLELTLHAKNGSEVIVIGEATPIGDPKLGDHLVTFFDITWRVQIEQKSEASRKLAQSTIDALPAHIAVLDREGRILAVNKAWQRFGDSGGLPSFNWIGVNYFKAIESVDGAYAHDAHSAISLLRDVLNGTTQQGTFEYVCPSNGVDLRFLMTVSRFGDGTQVGLVISHHDVTGLRQAQEQLKQSEKLAAVGQLTGGVAHDVNNDLAVILGAAELIHEKADPGSRLEVLSKRIIGTVERSASLVQRMLTFSRKASIDPVKLDLSKTVGEIVATMRRTLGGRVSLLYTPPALPLWVNVDRSMLESSLINLAVNARDAMPDGGTLTFALSAERREELVGSSEWVVLSATDTGIGMSEETRKRVFEPFFTTKPLGGGTGLGLATVYGFVRQSGGDIDVQSTLGKGTTFTIRLPQVQPPEAPQQQAADKGQAGHSHTVLIVEDNECPSSEYLRHAVLFVSGGSGSSVV